MGADLKRITDAVSGPSWSPNGERLAYAAEDGEEVVLYTIAADGSHARRVTAVERWSWHPGYGEIKPVLAWIPTLAWSPDGSKILYTCGPLVCVVKPDGTPVSRTPIGLSGGTVAAWSPDGDRIAVASAEASDDDTVLYSMAPDGSDLRVLVRSDDEGRLQSMGARRRDGPVDVSGCTAGVAVPDPEADPGLVEDCERLLEIMDVLAGRVELDWNTDRPMTRVGRGRRRQFAAARPTACALKARLVGSYPA